MLKIEFSPGVGKLSTISFRAVRSMLEMRLDNNACDDMSSCKQRNSAETCVRVCKFYWNEFPQWLEVFVHDIVHVAQKYAIYNVEVFSISTLLQASTVSKPWHSAQPQIATQSISFQKPSKLRPWVIIRNRFG